MKHSVAGHSDTTPYNICRSACGWRESPKPGEISLAHNGVLFLDELPEFPRQCIGKSLREPLESGKIIISRAHHQVSFPANFQLIAAMNPCPCGYYGDNTNRCECTNDKILRYRSKVSGPLLDRIDIHIDVPSLPSGTLSDPRFAPKDEEHDQALKQVNTAHSIMMARSRKLNSELSNRDIEEHCTLEDHDQKLLDTSHADPGLVRSRVLQDSQGCPYHCGHRRTGIHFHDASD